MIAIIRTPLLAHHDLRPDQQCEILERREWTEDGHRREAIVVQGGAGRVGLWPHEYRILEHGVTQMRLEGI